MQSLQVCILVHSFCPSHNFLYTIHSKILATMTVTELPRKYERTVQWNWKGHRKNAVLKSVTNYLGVLLSLCGPTFFKTSSALNENMNVHSSVSCWSSLISMCCNVERSTHHVGLQGDLTLTCAHGEWDYRVPQGMRGRKTWRKSVETPTSECLPRDCLKFLLKTTFFLLLFLRNL